MRSMIKMATRYPWSVSKAYYSGRSFTVSSQDTAVYGLYIKSDGLKLYTIGDQNNSVYQYTLSSAWDISTASYDSVSFSVGGQEGEPQGIFFKSDGTKFYIVGNVNKTVYQYTLSTAWDLSTASYDSVSFLVSSENSAPSAIFFKSDGTKFYIIGRGTDKAIYQYSLSSAWDLTTSSYDSVSFLVSSQNSIPTGFAISTNGAKMFVMGRGGTASIYQYTLSTAWNLSTASYDSVSLPISTIDDTPVGVLFQSSNGMFIYFSGQSNAKVFQYFT